MVLISSLDIQCQNGMRVMDNKGYYVGPRQREKEKEKDKENEREAFRLELAGLHRDFDSLGDLCAIRAACRFDRDTQPYIAVERATSTRSTPSGRAVFSLYWQEVEQTGAREHGHQLGLWEPSFSSSLSS
eukprot:s2655_g16.t1